MIKLPEQNKPITKVLKLFNTILVESIDIEYRRYINEKAAHQVFDYLFEQYTSINYYTFFTLPNISNVCQYVFESIIVRDFLFNVTDRVLLSLPSEDMIDTIVKHTAEQYSKTKHNQPDALVLPEIQSSIAINAEVLQSVLKKDLWLLVLFQSIFLFHKTEIYKEIGS